MNRSASIVSPESLARDSLPSPASRLARLITWMGIPLLLICVTLIAYAPVWHNQYVNIDDVQYVPGNPHVNGGLSWAGVRWAFTTFYASNWHPLTWLSLMADVTLFGLNAPAEHLVNLAIHTLTSVLLYLVLVRMTARAWASAFVAAIFAVHPLHVESVAWVAERKDVLSALFFVLTLLCYDFYTRRISIVRYLLCLLVYAVGLLAKPMLVTVPFVLLLLDVWPLRRFDRPRLRLILLEKLGMIPLVIASCIVTYLAQSRGGSVIQQSIISLDSRLANAIVSVGRYILLSIFPHHLSVYYIYRFDLPWWEIAGSALLIVVISIFALIRVRREPYLLVGWLMFLGMLVPVIGLVQVGSQALANRYMYLPLIGLALMVTWFLTERATGRISKGALAILAIAAIALCVARTHIEAAYWRDSIALFNRAVQIDPDNFVAHHNLGDALTLEGRFEEAAQHERRAVELSRDFWRARSGLALDLAYLHRFDEAKREAQASLAMQSNNPYAYFTLGYLAGVQADHASAIRYSRLAIASDPYFPEPHYNLGVAYMETGQNALAEQEFRRTIELDPFHPGAHARLGAMLMHQGKNQQAREELTNAVTLQPGDIESYLNLWLVSVRLKDVPRAQAALREVVKRSPNLMEPKENLAWLLATAPNAKDRNGAEALKLAKEANEQSHANNPAVMDTLAAALAETGQLQSALQIDRAALELAQRASNSSAAAQIAQHVTLLERGEPIRDESLK